MTMAEVKSIEETLIKISLKQLWFLVTFLIGGTVFAVMLYASIMQGQEAILAEVKKNAVERNYQIMDIRKDVESVKKDIAAFDNRIARMEK